MAKTVAFRYAELAPATSDASAIARTLRAEGALIDWLGSTL